MDQHRQTELSDEEKARRRASQRNEIIESFNSEIDSVVRNASHRLTQNERKVIKQWAADMKGQLGTDGKHSFAQALRDVKVEKRILLAIRKFADKVRYTETADSVFTEDKSNIVKDFQPRTIVDKDFESKGTLHSIQHSLAHSSRINGRHAQILDIETGKRANDGGYWLN